MLRHSQEEFSAMRDQWFRQGDAFIILYSIAVRTTFEEVQYVPL
jgi:GTPase KRas